jgi:hypothetical protein
MRFSMKMMFAPDIELRMQPSERGSSQPERGSSQPERGSSHLHGTAAIGQQMFDWH